MHPLTFTTNASTVFELKSLIIGVENIGNFACCLHSNTGHFLESLSVDVGISLLGEISSFTTDPSRATLNKE